MKGWRKEIFSFISVACTYSRPHLHSKAVSYHFKRPNIFTSMYVSPLADPEDKAVNFPEPVYFFHLKCELLIGTCQASPRHNLFQVRNVIVLYFQAFSSSPFHEQDSRSLSLNMEEICQPSPAQTLYSF